METDSGAHVLMAPDTNESNASGVTLLARTAQTPSRYRILVVDDDEMIRDLFSRVLASDGHEVIVAGDGKQAMALADQERPDLVITDLVMPEQEGIETIRRLRASHPGMKIMAVSGGFEGSYLKVAKHLGAQAALLKPVLPKDLLSAVRQVLG